ncbi:MAG TPA: RNA polymerase sigma factor [Polyangiaceae bacterium]
MVPITTIRSMVPIHETQPPPCDAYATVGLDFRSVFDNYGVFVKQTLRRLGVPSADRHDLSQEIFVVVHRKLHEYDGRASLRSWIYGICVRMASTYRRSARVRHEKACEQPEPNVAANQEAANQDSGIDSRRAYAHIETLLGKLDDEKRTIFVLYEIEGLSMTEVAEAVGCPLQTAYSRLHAARKAMRASLARSLLRPPNSA